MSSARFETVLTPRKLLRRLLLFSGCSATLVGAMLIFSLPLVPELKALFCTLWLLSGLLEMKALRFGMSRIDRIRIRADGAVDGFDLEGAEYPLRLLPGSIVLDRIAWLRLGFANGRSYGELLTGNAGESEHWRRLQLIWRHQASVFGRGL